MPQGKGSNFHTQDVGDGWVREGGAKRGPGEFPRVTFDEGMKAALDWFRTQDEKGWRQVTS